MKNRSLKAFLTTAALLCGSMAFAVGAAVSGGEGMPAVENSSTYRIEAGAGSILETYLSPLKYHGASMALSGSWRHALRGSKTVEMTFDGSIEGFITRSPAKNANMYLGSISFDWGVRRLWKAGTNWRLGIGGGPRLDAGVIYEPRNGNNPAAAKCAVAAEISAFGSYSFNWLGKRLTVTDDVRLPSASIFFSQQYGESYYEIYRGNHSGLVHFGWWGNNFCIDNLLSIEIPMKKGALTAGYHFKVRSSYICDINTQAVSHAFVVGWKF